jgi:uncharacterized protein YbjT (DUF2867 family)
MIKIAITGANSSVGVNLLRTIVRDTQFDVIAGIRSEKAIATLPTSPRIEPRIISYNNTACLASSLADADVVVHLAGILIESANSNYSNGNIDATTVAVAAAKKNGVKHFVLISVVGADAHSENRYFASKGLAESAVIQGGIPASIIRTPILLGGNTAGTQALVNAAKKAKANVLGGGNYSVRPLDIDDLSKAILNCFENIGGHSKQSPHVAIHELAGPESITYRKLIELVARMMGNKVAIGSVPLWLAKLAARLKGLLRSGGITPTVIDVITADELIATNADIDLRLTLTPLKTTVKKILEQR